MKNKEKLPIINTILFVMVLILIGAFFAYSSARIIDPTYYINSSGGYVDISDESFEGRFCQLGNEWEKWQMKLYSPEDFKHPETLEKISGLETPLYGTYRLILKCKPKLYLELVSYSVDYATRVFVNGEEVRNIGYVSADEKENVHNVRYMRLPLYSGDDGEIEIIYQYSNYMHNDGSFVPLTYIGSPEKIDEYVRGRALTSIMQSSGLIFLGFYFLLSAAFLLNPEYAALSICCFVIAFRNSFFFAQYLLDPNIDFILSYRLNTLVTSLVPAVSTFLFAVFYRKAVSKVYTAVGIGIYSVFSVLHFLVDSHDLVFLCHVCYYECAVVFAGVVVMIFIYFIKNKKFDIIDFATLTAMFLIFGYTLYESINTRSDSLINHFGKTPLGFLFCILLLALVINIRIWRRDIELREEQQKNEVLGQINSMNRDFLQNVAHELKTPLTVISGYAQLMEMQAERAGGQVNSPERLKTIRSEADRLGEIVTKLMDYTYGKTDKTAFSSVDCDELLNGAAAILRPVCLKKDNTFTAENCVTTTVYGNFELLLQVLINLCVNANKHTEKGLISVSTVDDGDFVRFVVSDTGNGIKPEDVEHIFERGYTKDGGTGLGLSICSDTIKLHGGRIELTKTGKDGTVFSFTVPKKN